MNKRKKNYYLRVNDIQDIYRLQKVHEGIMDAWIYETHIYPIYRITYATFRFYLSINVKKILNEMKN
jgi:hypothetical protein